MKREIIGILVITLLIATAVLPIAMSMNDLKDKKGLSMLNNKHGCYQNSLQPIDLTVGICDGFDPSPPVEPTSPWQHYLLDWIDKNYPGTGGSRDCDETGYDRFWAHTFDLEGICNMSDIIGATLSITVKNGDSNDGLNLGCIDSDTDIWDVHDTLINWGVSVGNDGTIIIDIKNNYPNLFNEMIAHGWLDVIVQDDSVVDCATLTIECCQFSYEIVKVVWDPNVQQWVEKIDAKVCTEVTFGISIVNSPASSTCPLFNVIVVDELPKCLEYVQGSSTWANYLSVVGNKLTWDFGSMVTIGAGQALTIIFDAHVISTGLNRNLATFYANNLVSGSDSAIVIGRINCTDINDLSCPPIAWWPLDSLNTINVNCQDIIGPYNGKVVCGKPEVVAGKINGACRFNHEGANLGVIRVKDDPFEDIGGGDFTIDAWINPEKLKPYCRNNNPHNCEDRIILDNHVYNRHMFTPPEWTYVGSGVTFFVKNENWDDINDQWTTMRLGLVMNNKAFLSDTAPIVHNIWQHVSVTVSRTGGNFVGTFYYNGAQTGSTFIPISGNLYATGSGFPKLDIGHASPFYCGSCWHTNDFFNGLLDEIEIFDCCLTKSDIEAIYNADSKGKCKQYGGKTVSTDDGETWNEQVSADVDQTLTFKIMIVNSGKNIINNIEVVDILPNCLEYIEGSAEPVEPTVLGNNLSWNFENIGVNDTEEIHFDAVIQWQPDDLFQYNYIECTGDTTGTILFFDDTATIVIGETIPDLKCSGSLSWSDIKPRATVEGSFSVENVGEVDSNLYWDIESLPDWGTWNIVPFSGENIKPDDGPVVVDVEVEVPNEMDTAFSGEVKIVNRNDPNDYEIIQVTLTTPKNKEFNFQMVFLRFLMTHPNISFIMRNLLSF